MSWPLFLAVVGLLFAVGRLIDKYHNQAVLESKLSNMARSALVGVFVFLDNQNFVGLTRAILAGPLRYQLLAYAATVTAWLLFSYQSVVATVAIFIALAWWTNSSFEVLASALVTVGVIGLVALDIYVVRAIARRVGDVLMLIVLLSLPFVTGALFFSLAMLAELVANDAVPLSSDPKYADGPSFSPTRGVMVMVAFVAVMPMVLTVFACANALLVKISLDAAKLVLMKICDAASHPGVDPFTYLATLGGIFLTAAKILSDLLAARAAQG